jgi:ribonucleotide reductase alpha subunit
MSYTELPSPQTATNPFGQEEMYVTKRNGKTEIISFDKILRRLRRLGTDSNLKINYTTLAMKVIDQLYDKIPSTKIDELSADQCASLASTHPDYNTLAGRIVVSNHHRSTNASFSKVMRQLYEFKDSHGVNHPMISKELYQTVCAKSKEFDAICKYERDYLIDYFGFKTLEKSYLMKINRATVERPQHMWLRVSIGIHGSDIDAVKETYEAMSQKYFTHATPTLFNAGTPRPQLSSCFLLSLESDSIDGIYNTLKDCAMISKWAGGIGLHIHNVRSHGSYIRGTNGSSNGIVPMLRVFNNTAKYVDQCVTPDTPIFTKTGYKPISSIQVGEVICNRSIPESPDFGKGDFYRANDTRGPALENSDDISTTRIAVADGYGVVKRIVEHYVTDAEICIIKQTTNGKDHFIRITPEHPVFAIQSENWSDPLSRGEWIEAGKLAKGDYLLFGQNKTTYHIVSDVERTRYTGLLYDLEIEEGSSPNYLTPDALLHNGGGKRNGSFAIYLEPWHADVEMFLQMRKNHGDEELKARDLFYALWIPDLFMQRVKEGGQWTLMCPDECPGLSDCYGDQFVELYTKYEREGRGKRTMLARDLWFQVLDAQMETGTPYILYKDACNIKSNQKNLGTIKSSNLCVAPETRILTDKGHVEISSVADKQVTVWNGFEWSTVSVKKTGVDQELIEVRTNDGCDLSCTKYHKFYVMSENDTNQKYRETDAKDLRVGDRLFRNPFPVIKDAHLIPALKRFSELAETNATVSDGCVRLVANYYFLKEYKFFLQTCGINPFLTKNTATDKWELLLTKLDVAILSENGFHCENMDFTELRDSSKDVIVTEIIDSGRRDDTYCFNEPLRHLGVFNGLLTGQCTEIVEYSDSNETAVCNLASIGLPMFVNTETGTFDYEYLHHISKIVTRNLNKVININYYPTEKTRLSNLRHRPIGIGVQGLADVFIQMGIAFHSEDAKVVNRNIFETIYHAAVEQSMELAKIEGPYETFAGSPASKGELQFDMWNVMPSNRYDWGTIRKNIQEFGMRNSLLVAPMPTASTSQILGFNECIEPLTSNIYSRRTLAGEFILANKYLMSDLIKLDLWNEKIKNNIIANNGSVQHIDVIPKEIRDKYKTVWEIPMRHLIDMAADRGAFICQSQSLNLWLEDPNYNTLTSMHFYSWTKGLKTGIYYLRRRAKHQAQQFTIEPEKRTNKEEDEHDICEYCSA